MKYILKKEYPGSPKLGTIVEGKFLGHYRDVLMQTTSITSNLIEKYPEFWEKVVEKDYEILSFKTITNKILKKDSQINSFCEKDGNSPFYSENELLNGVGCSIHSVKRNDGKIFTVGDKTEFGDIIKYFKIDNKSNLLIIGYKDCEDVLEFVGHSKQKLFTTEDDVDIFKGDSYVALLSNYDLTQEKAGFNHDNIYCNCLKFSTKEKAEEYILYNKHCLSLNDIFKDVEEMRKGLKTFENSQLAKRFKKLVKQKLNNKN